MKYRKKSIVIDAEPYRPGLEDGFSCIPFVMFCKWKDENGKYHQCKECPLNIKKQAFILTLEGNLYINDGDWIITGVEGERSLINPDIFEMIYEPVFKCELEP